tara:strand:- start:1717 stop:2169 length:453 start_codon:yes stop_codon:yes gene_type:complete
MTNQINSQSGKVKKHAKSLLILTSIFALLYLGFIILTFIPASAYNGTFGPDGSPVNNTVPYDPFDVEQIFVKGLFVLFLVGYLALWKHEAIGGVAFLLWWVAVWGVELIIVAPLHFSDAVVGIIAGLPLFVFGILFVRGWYKKRSVQEGR